MQTIMFSKAREELAGLLDRVTRDRVPVEIVRRDKPSVVIVDKDEYEGMMETLHLLSSPINAARLLTAVQDIDAAGPIDFKDLIEPRSAAE
ncbi:type II toxin-antitoxin system prevent-host-death family antitoxin [Rhizobium sp. CG5]|uniref:type II toxin-antitoxin system Phd/YefM family antitoxin n=1 Tax=Rhizobium sp. CG5 TaxID=2726076 RepID=UPI002033A238|nr:type II toxin-antitoxin system prevent-host-death family antitoxin [Rhizobium sp. CG5]MCM2473087.1 type II toxin-antitoxin system prevent-host-death family antitoxin [Rhizobium sp. CG5]